MSRSNSNMNKPKQKFTKEEDEILIKQVQIHGEKHWNSVAKSLQGRTAKQCRERWKNYLSPQVSHNEWTQDEELLLTKLVNKYGKKWSKIAKYFPTRTDVSIKNRWALLCRQINKLKTKTQTNKQVISPPEVHKEKGLKLQLPIQIPIINLDQLKINNILNNNSSIGEIEQNQKQQNSSCINKIDDFSQFIDT